jgi:hypothetical protein
MPSLRPSEVQFPMRPNLMGGLPITVVLVLSLFAREFSDTAWRRPLTAPAEVYSSGLT